MKLNLLLMLVFASVLIGSCASNKNNNKGVMDEEGFQTPVPVNVGTANVQLEFVSFDDGIMVANVVEVFGYGASTSPFSLNSEVPFYVNETLVEEISSMSSGSVFNGSVSMERESMDQSSTPKWRLISITE